MYGEAGFNVSTRPQFSAPLPLALSKAKFALCTCLALSPSELSPWAEGELASHTHTEYTDDLFCAYQTGNNNNWKQGLVNAEEKSKSVTYEHWIGSAGGNQPHNNLPPFYSVFRFRRTTWFYGNDIRHKVAECCCAGYFHPRYSYRCRTHIYLPIALSTRIDWSRQDSFHFLSLYQHYGND